MSDIYKGGMTNERFLFLSDPNCRENLTKEEQENGWHFCLFFDGMLIHKTDEEHDYCHCTKNEDYQNNE